MQIMTECEVHRHASLTVTKESQPFVTTYLEITSIQKFSYSVLKIDVPAAQQPHVLSYMRPKLTKGSVCFDFHSTE